MISKWWMVCTVVTVLTAGTVCAQEWKVTDSGAVGDGKTDCTTAFQTALDQAGKAGGGVVNVPAGKFRINGNLVIPGGVTLQGTFRSPPTAHLQGSVLLAFAGRGNPKDKPFIRLGGHNATISGIIITYPKKVKKISAVLKPVEQITSLQQRIDVAPSSTQRSLDGTLDDTLVSRTITVKVMNPGNGELIFKANQPVTVVPGGDVQSLVLMKVKGTIAPRETTLSLRLIDDETEEVLEQKPIVLKLDLDEWD